MIEKFHFKNGFVIYKDRQLVIAVDNIDKYEPIKIK